MTPDEFYVVSRACFEKEKLELETRVTIAYLQANWTAAWLSKKKPPKLDGILEKIREQDTPREMTDDEIAAKVMALNAALGGEVIG